MTPITSDEQALAVLREAINEGRYERDRVDARSAAEWQDECVAALEHLRTRLAKTGPAVDGWLPIETAPADTFVLLLVKWSDEPVVAEKRNGQWYVGTEHHKVRCGGYCYGGEVGTDGTLAPTHWRPLPEPPTAALEARG